MDKLIVDAFLRLSKAGDDDEVANLAYEIQLLEMAIKNNEADSTNLVLSRNKLKKFKKSIDS